MEIRNTLDFNTELDKSLKFINDSPYGIELDCDAVSLIPASALTPSGFSVNQARKYINTAAYNKNAMYLHICEASVSQDNPENNLIVGKFIAYLITDFIKSKKRLKSSS